MKRLFICALILQLALITGRGQAVTQVAAGGSHSLFLEADGTLWAMGENQYGQLGDGTTNNINHPEQITKQVVAVSAGYYHSLFLKADGSLWAMGWNQYGQLGDGTTNDSHVPKRIITNGIAAFSAGELHSLFVKSDGSLWAAGDNHYGELGDGTTNSRYLPKQITNGVAAVTGGYLASLFVKTNGTLWTMGLNVYGELGIGSTNDSHVPVQVTANGISDGGITAMAGGDGSSIFVQSGTLWDMGDNEYGQLGQGRGIGTGEYPYPITNGVTAVSAGAHTLFLRMDGSLWGMGYNLFGELGDGATTNSYVPKLIVPDSVASISAGLIQSLFIKTDGSLWAMGNNQYGQLGDGTTNDSHIPKWIAGPIVTNGGFESGNFAGWTTGGNFVSSGVTLNDPLYVHSGKYGAQMGPGSTLGSLSQTMRTKAGASYLLSFWLDSPDGQTPNEFSLSWNGVTLLDKKNFAATGWTNLQFVVTATVTNTVLQFGFRNDNSYFGFDNVSVTPPPFPAPRITGVQRAGDTLMLNASNGLGDETYYVLTATNLAQPMSQWSPVATNLINAGGGFTVTLTNAVNPGQPGRFFLLELK